MSSQIEEIGLKLFNNPELGYKEHQTKAIIIDFLSDCDTNVQIEEFSTTGVKVQLNNQYDLNIAFVAEMDAVYAPNHWAANVETKASHNCGHHSQVAIALALFKYFSQLDENDQKNYLRLNYNLHFIFVPAEEFIDLDFRENLKKNGVIEYYGGKPEAMRQGVFDDIDLAVCVHAIGGQFSERTIEFNCDLAGFVYKYYHFKGKPSHAGFDPFSGVNAYNISTLFNNALGFMRQQFDEKNFVRINPVVVKSDMSLNIVPDSIIIGTDIRAMNSDYMLELSEKIDQASIGSSIALGGQVEVETMLGYLPFKQSRYLTSLFTPLLEKHPKIKNVITDQKVSASGDVGDLNYMLPVIQVGYSGFKGTIHGNDFDHDDLEMIYEIFPNYLCDVFLEIGKNVDKNKLYKRSYDDYKKMVDSFK